MALKTTIIVNGDDRRETVTLDGNSTAKLQELADTLKNGGKKPKKAKDDGSVETSKEFNKFLSEFGEEYAEEFLAKTTQQLKDSVAINHMEVARSKQEVEDTPAFKQASQDLKDLKGALNEKIKPNKISIALATKILNLRQDAEG
jgi:hypothetical protein